MKGMNWIFVLKIELFRKSKLKKPEADGDYLHRLHLTTLVQEEVQDNQTV